MTDSRPHTAPFFAQDIIAPAKVNLALHIVGRRGDGYHSLSSVMAFTPDIGDVLTIRVGEAGGDFTASTLRVYGDFAGALNETAASDNLIIRALHAVAPFAARQDALDITLDKRLPVAAGLGGGSSDAAALLRVLAPAYGVALDAPEVQKALIGLGTELPVCLRAQAALVSGVGEVITPIASFPSFGIVLVNPLVPLSTVEAFKKFAAAPRYSAPLPPPPQSGSQSEWAAYLRPLGNDFEPVARDLCPATVDILHVLAQDKTALLARMSGSGATCFALFETPMQAQAAAVRYRAAFEHDYWIASGTISATS